MLIHLTKPIKVLQIWLRLQWYFLQILFALSQNPCKPSLDIWWLNLLLTISPRTLLCIAPPLLLDLNLLGLLLTLRILKVHTHDAASVPGVFVLRPFILPLVVECLHWIGLVARTVIVTDALFVIGERIVVQVVFVMVFIRWLPKLLLPLPLTPKPLPLLYECPRRLLIWALIILLIIVFLLNQSSFFVLSIIILVDSVRHLLMMAARRNEQLFLLISLLLDGHSEGAVYLLGLVLVHEGVWSLHVMAWWSVVLLDILIWLEIFCDILRLCTYLVIHLLICS